MRIVDVPLIPAARQRVWGSPAVVNFGVGGLGAGFYVAAVLAAAGGDADALPLAAWLGPALVLAGFAAVATEAGRPLRGVRILARVRSSWMSREALFGGLFVLLAAVDLVAPVAAVRAGATVAALAYVVAQGCMLRAARGVAAWSVAAMPAVFVASALLSGAGALLLAVVAGGTPPGAAVLGWTMFLLVVTFFVWLVYLTWSAEPSFVDATRALREGTPALVTGAGYLIPFVLCAAAQAWPEWRALAGGTAGALIVLAQLATKFQIVLTLGVLRPIALGRPAAYGRPA